MKKDDSSYRIGIDLLGEDALAEKWLPAIFNANFPHDLFFTLFATAEQLAPYPTPPPHLLFHPVTEMISMEDEPIAAVRKKPDSSLCLGIKQLHLGQLDAFISAGNTGALLIASTLYLSMLPKVNRPALLTLLPTQKEELAVLDVGANAIMRAKHLVQFALMGAAFQKTRNIKQPKVGLLNIGTEAKKGTPELKKAYTHLSRMQDRIHFVGNIEARDVFRGEIDVLVTDGFSGNVFLKTAEGIAAVILEELEQEKEIQQERDFKKILHALRHRLHYTEYPGALLCGVKGLVFKCHGNTSGQSLVRSITHATRLLEHGFLEKVEAQLSGL